MNSLSPRVALIHALAHSVAPINHAMARLWPQAMCMNLLDDSLSADLARATAAGRDGLGPDMQARFETLARYADDCGADAILFTCSAFGPCIEAVAARRPGKPVLKPNEAMVDEAVALAAGRPVGLIASFAPTLQSMPSEFPPAQPLHVALAAGAMAALDAGDLEAHDRAVAAAARWLVDSHACEVVALAQFSMARAETVVREAVSVPVLTTPGSAVRALRRRLGVSQ